MYKYAEKTKTLSQLIKPLPIGSDEIFLIRGEEGLDYYCCNSLLIGDVLIDTGISNNYLTQIINEVQINKVIFTHWHEDHTAGSSLMKNCDFLCHLNGKQIIENKSSMKTYYGYEEYPSEKVIQYLSMYDLTDIQITRTIKDNDVITMIENIPLKVIHTPGHASDLCCFYEENLKFAYLSDIAMPESGPWYGGMDSSLLDYEKSLERILKLDIHSAALSHIGFLEEKSEIKDIIHVQQNYIQKRDEQILSYLSEKAPKSSKDLWKEKIIFTSNENYEQYLEYTEKIMIDKHFEKFLKKRIIEPMKDGFILS